MAALKDRCTCMDLSIDCEDVEVGEPHAWPQTPFSPLECQNEKQMFGKGPVPGPAEPVRTMNPNADVFIPQGHWLPGQLPPPQVQHMCDGRLNMAVHPVMPMNMPQAHFQHVANCIPLAPNNLPVPPPPQHAAPLTAQFGLPTLLRTQPQMRQNMEMQKFLPAPPKPPAPPTHQPQNLPALQPEETTPPPPTREECIKHAEEVLEEQRSFLGQLGIMPLEEARRAWFHAMSNVFKGPGPTGPGLEDLRVMVPSPDDLPERAEERIDEGPVGLPTPTPAALPQLADEGALVEASPKMEETPAEKAKGAEGKKSPSAPASPGQKAGPTKDPVSPGQKRGPTKAKPAASQEWAPHLHAASRPWPYSPGVVSKGSKGGKGGAGKDGKGSKGGKAAGKGKGNGKGKGPAMYTRTDGKVWAVKQAATEPAAADEQPVTSRRPRARGKMNTYATGN